MHRTLMFVAAVATSAFLTGPASPAVAQGILWRVSPTVKQGEVLKVEIERAAPDFPGASVRAPWKEVPLFSDGPGRFLALLPVPVDQAPGPYTLAVPGVREFSVEVVDARYPKQDIRVTPAMKSLQPSTDEGEVVRRFLAAVTAERYWTQPFSVPTAGCVNSQFGVRRFHNGTYSGRFHAGLDHRGAAGTPVVAAAGGVVRIARKFGYRGGTVGIDHGQGVSSMYLHLSRIAVKEGETVRKGRRIGYIGATGFATGPHLHWSVYVHGVPVSPGWWTPKLRFCGERSPAVSRPGPPPQPKRPSGAPKVKPRSDRPSPLR